MEDAEYIDEIDDEKMYDDVSHKQGPGRRTKVWQSIHENMDIQSEISRTRIDGLYKGVAWTRVDLVICFWYYKARSAVCRTKKSVSRSLSQMIVTFSPASSHSYLDIPILLDMCKRYCCAALLSMYLSMSCCTNSQRFAFTNFPDMRRCATHSIIIFSTACGEPTFHTFINARPLSHFIGSLPLTTFFRLQKSGNLQVFYSQRVLGCSVIVRLFKLYYMKPASCEIPAFSIYLFSSFDNPHASASLPLNVVAPTYGCPPPGGSAATTIAGHLGRGEELRRGYIFSQALTTKEVNGYQH